ncbi:hypothetical protein TrLO_g6300 [Triparma laevis f. longispina]|uniref:Uncharacterized protein n=1 Tax=Triparma laevis f. longispina TaxID=1714387 RepID=A0A9W7KYL4_9STRA|nr:hypothetical protein TrLO_g6300 [Triparma laevis f. longispina]
MQPVFEAIVNKLPGLFEEARADPQAFASLMKERLMPTTGTDLTKLTGMSNLKNKINGIGAEESDAKDLDKLCEEAGAVLPVFAEKVRGIVEGLGMDADAYTVVEGERIVDDGFEFKALTCAPLKWRARAEEKTKDDYEKNFKCMLDLVRCSIIVETEEQLGGVLGKMLELGIVVRLKNRFANPLPTEEGRRGS